MVELAMAICCGEICRSETPVCHHLDHFEEAYRVRKLLDRCREATLEGRRAAE
jgi:hypothetical protein